MEMILLDWTRMGSLYCLAGAVRGRGGWRLVRPLLAKSRAAPVRNVGWSPFRLDGFKRWEIFDLVDPVDAAPQPPHTEDVWVRALRPLRRSAPAQERRAILQAFGGFSGELFGAPLVLTRASAFLAPGSGTRSLATVWTEPKRIAFSACRRFGVAEADVRVTLPRDVLRIPAPPRGDATLTLPLKDHHLLSRAEAAGSDLRHQLAVLEDAVWDMGDALAVRLGVSRPFQAGPGSGTGQCWLMVDGLFSANDPQP